jgi:hypothetical protein
LKNSRALDPIEVRVLGSLLEKQQTTPEYYPLTVNGLMAATNQKTNREPVMELSESDVLAALERLQDELLVWKVLGSRVTRYDHNLEKQWQLGPASKALMSVLFLRGPQTGGELRSRTERMYRFEAMEDIDVQLRAMAAGGFVVELPRRPGQKETRWMHLAGGDVIPDEHVETPVVTSASSGGGEPLAARVERLERELSEVREQLAELRRSLGA